MSSREPFIWFDFGGVLSPPLSDLFAEYERRTRIPTEVLKEAMSAVARDMSVPTLAPIELGLLSEEEWVKRQHAYIAKRYPEVDTSFAENHFGRQWFESHEPNREMRQFVIDLVDEGYEVGILSNNVIEWEPYWRKMVNLDHVVSDIVDSCKVGVRKPDPSIFRIAAERVGRKMENCILIDDLEENCRSARLCGWKSVQFVDTWQSIGKVRNLLEELRNHQVG